jgi:hypothetical protein
MKTCEHIEGITILHFEIKLLYSVQLTPCRLLERK